MYFLFHADPADCCGKRLSQKLGKQVLAKTQKKRKGRRLLTINFSFCVLLSKSLRALRDIYFLNKPFLTLN